MKILAFDLETSPMLSWHWGRWQQNIAPVQTVQESRVLCFGARWVGSKQFIFRSEYDHGRPEMLAEIHRLLSEADAVMSWNGKKFDSKKIRTEFLRDRLGPVPKYHDLDLMLAVRSQFSFSSNKLDAVAQELGVGSKVSHEGFGLWLKVMAGDEKARRLFRRYQKQDVDLLVDLYDILKPWIPNHPNVALHDGTPEAACTRCGGSDLIRRGFAFTASGKYRRYECKTCHGWSTSARREATTDLRSA